MSCPPVNRARDGFPLLEQKAMNFYWQLPTDTCISVSERYTFWPATIPILSRRVSRILQQFPEASRQIGPFIARKTNLLVHQRPFRGLCPARCSHTRPLKSFPASYSTRRGISFILRRMHLIDGQALAANIRKETTQDVAALGRRPRLNVLLVGNDAASRLYVGLKEKAGQEVGIDVTVSHHPATASQTELETIIDTWNENPSVDAILIQLPLPPGFDTDALIQRIDMKKDADGFHPENPNLVSPLHEGILRLIASTPLKLPGTQAVIVANSNTFALPLEKLLQTGGASVEIMLPDDLVLSRLSDADLVIAAIGRPHFLHAAMLKSDAILIDVGTTRENGKTLGDFDIDSIRETDCWLTPVPGGVGPMTVALLLKNVFRLASID